MTLLDELRGKKKLYRGDIAELLASIGAPGEAREEKLLAVRELGKSNFQGHSLETTLDSYQEY